MLFDRDLRLLGTFSKNPRSFQAVNRLPEKLFEKHLEQLSCRKNFLVFETEKENIPCQTKKWWSWAKTAR